MKRQTKVSKATDVLLAAMKSAGINTNTIDVVAVKQESLAQKPLPHYEAEAVLSFLEKPARFAFKPCKFCSEMFGTNYRSVAYCTDHCRIRGLRKHGIIWSSSKSPEQRWGGEPPLVIPPEAVRILLQSARQIGLNEELEMQQNIEFSHSDLPLPEKEKTVSLALPNKEVEPVKFPVMPSFDF